MHLPPLDLSPLPVATMSHGGGIYSRPSTASTQLSPEFHAVQKLIRHVLRTSRISIQQVERLPSPLHRLFLLSLNDHSRYILKCSPHYHIRLLRYELRSLESEAKVLDLLTKNTQLPVPQCIKQSSGSGSLGSPYLLRTYLPGRCLADLIPYLSPAERAMIDRQLGSYCRTISSLRAQTFGTTHRVFSGNGYLTWRESFHALIEAVLRDAEDMLISVPYDSIRRHVSAQEYMFDMITESRLVLLEAGEPRCVLVDEQTRQICGLLGFGKVIWGDPMMARVFNIDEAPSSAFWDGWGAQVDAGHAGNVRRLLYIVYRSLITIVTHHYRPQHGSDELEARRTLTWALDQLEAV